MATADIKQSKLQATLNAYLFLMACAILKLLLVEYFCLRVRCMAIAMGMSTDFHSPTKIASLIMFSGAF
jgi:hypothetical protein